MEAETLWARLIRLGYPDSEDQEKSPGFISYSLCDPRCSETRCLLAIV